MQKDNKLKLEPTAALVMKGALSLYQKSPALEFVKRLDLSSGTELYVKCRSFCDWYGEIILNRKNFIRHLIEQRLTADEREYQIIILAAGKSPLAIEITSEYAGKIHRIFEIDISGMDDKQCIYNSVFPEYADKMKCLKSDISCGDIPLILNSGNTGYRNELPSIVIIEGISYYLKEKDLKGIIAGFRHQIEAYLLSNTWFPAIASVSREDISRKKHLVLSMMIVNSRVLPHIQKTDCKPISKSMKESCLSVTQWRIWSLAERELIHISKTTRTAGLNA
jgi:hypothetical protein